MEDLTARVLASDFSSISADHQPGRTAAHSVGSSVADARRSFHGSWWWSKVEILSMWAPLYPPLPRLPSAWSRSVA